MNIYSPGSLTTKRHADDHIFLIYSKNRCSVSIYDFHRNSSFFDRRNSLSTTRLRLVVLYADVSGSTRLYEKFGDAVASADIHACLDLLTGVAEKYAGKKVKTIGDEVMCIFYQSEQAAQSAMEMNRALRDASEKGLFQSGELHIKIGWHHGSGTLRKNDIVGEAPLLAQQVIKMAKRDEILTTKKSIDDLPIMIKSTAIFIDRVEAEDGSGDIDVYALPWDDNDEATVIGKPPGEISGALMHSALILRYGDQQFEMNKKNTHCHVGRDENNDIVVSGNYTSRHHGQIYYRHGRFHLVDMSTNGTGLIRTGDNFVRLHREEAMLNDSGIICFGGEPGTDPQATVEYECIKAD